MAYARKKYRIPALDLEKLDPNILTLGQARAHSRVSDSTLMRLIRANILPVEQVALYAPYDIKSDDLDDEPVAGILEWLKMTGNSYLKGIFWLIRAVCLSKINRLHNGGIMPAYSC